MANKPSLKLILLTQRISDGDFTAVEELWPLLFTEPLDTNRPGEDVVQDIADRITLLYPTEEKKAEPEKDDFTALFEEAFELVNRLLNPKKA